MERGSIATIFAKCFRGIARLSAVVDDGFFVDLLNQESEKLLAGYVNFLKHKGSGSHISHVAQCRSILISRVASTLNLVKIIKHLKFKVSTTPLLLERDLLSLELAIINDVGMPVSGAIKREDRAVPVKTTPVVRVRNFANVSAVHKQIVDFIAGYDQVQNLDVFKNFSGIARRTLKRKLSELIGAGMIRRFSEGKKVFYGIDHSVGLASINAE